MTQSVGGSRWCYKGVVRCSQGIVNTPSYLTTPRIYNLALWLPLLWNLFLLTLTVVLTIIGLRGRRGGDNLGGLRG